MRRHFPITPQLLKLRLPAILPMEEFERPNPLVGWKLLRVVLGADIGVVGCWAQKLGGQAENVNDKRYNLIEKFPINESRFVF